MGSVKGNVLRRGRMKGIVFLSALIGILFPLKALYAKRKAKTDPVDPETLKKASFPNSSGH